MAIAIIYLEKKPVGEMGGGEKRGDRRSRGSLGPGTPGAKQQAVRKMDGLLTVPHMALSRVISPFTSPSRGAQRALIDCVLNYVFTCVSSINARRARVLKSAERYRPAHAIKDQGARNRQCINSGLMEAQFVSFIETFLIKTIL